MYHDKVERGGSMYHDKIECCGGRYRVRDDFDAGIGIGSRVEAKNTRGVSIPDRGGGGTPPTHLDSGEQDKEGGIGVMTR